MVHTILDAIKDTRVAGREKPGVRWPRSRLGHGAAVTAEATVPRTELIVAVYQRLRRLIVEGHLGPGARLVEAELATRFGVSRTPIRTALYQLLQEGFVEARAIDQDGKPLPCDLSNCILGPARNT